MSDESGEPRMAELSGIADAAGSRLRADAAEDHEAAGQPASDYSRR